MRILLIIPLLVNLTACSAFHQIMESPVSRPGTYKGKPLPPKRPCAEVQSPYEPCQAPVVSPSTCDKRFGKACK